MDIEFVHPVAVVIASDHFNWP